MISSLLFLMAMISLVDVCESSEQNCVDGSCGNDVDTNAPAIRCDDEIVPPIAIPTPKFSFERPQVMVIDDFLLNAPAIREFALRQQFNVSGNYPGMRTQPFCLGEIRAHLERRIGCRITYWPEHDHNCAFQIVTEGAKSWLHVDNTDYSAVFFLTPDAPPSSGTSFHQHRETQLFYRPQRTATAAARAGVSLEQLNEFLSPENSRVYQQYDQWIETDRIANRFNRLVLFNGRRFHTVHEYFGDSIFNGRLFQTFFFDVEC